MGTLKKNINYKLYLKLILSNFSFSFINNKGQSDHSNDMLLCSELLYYLALHFRFSSLFYSNQLVDIFSYEVPSTPSVISDNKAEDNLLVRAKYAIGKKGLDTVVVYNFHILNTQNR